MTKDKQKPTFKVSPIEEYFANKGEQVSEVDKLFSATEDDIKQKTEVVDKEIFTIAKMLFTDKYLESKGINKIFTPLINDILELKISKDRKSREEFVKVNSMQPQNEGQSEELGMNLRRLLGKR